MEKFRPLHTYPADKEFHGAAKHLYDTHHVDIMPAFDRSGYLIHPSMYEDKLPGAIVAVTLTFVRHAIGTTSSVLVANLDRLDVLVPPKTRSMFLRKGGPSVHRYGKRKATSDDAPVAGPSKRPSI